MKRSWKLCHRPQVAPYHPQLSSTPDAACGNGISRFQSAPDTSRQTHLVIVHIGCATPSNLRNAYLGINRKLWLPSFRWYDFTDPILSTLGSDFPHILHRIPKLFLCGSKSGRILQPMWSYPLVGLSHSQGMPTSLHRRHIQRWSSASAERNMRSIRWICAIVCITGEIHLETPGRRCGVCSGTGRGVPSS